MMPKDPRTTPGHIDAPIADGRKRKRGLPRAALACDSCRKRKSKCDQEEPCSSCVKHSFECSYAPKAALGKGSSPGAVTATNNHHTFNATSLTIQSRGPATGGAGRTPAFVPIAAAPDPSAQQEPAGSAGLSERPRSTPVSGHRHGDQSRGDGRSFGSNAEHETDSLGGLNAHTQGHEFYGPMGAFSFLSRLRSKALSEAGLDTESTPIQAKSTRNLEDVSIVNLLHSSDYPVAVDNNRRVRQASRTGATQPVAGGSHPARHRYATSPTAFADAGEWYRCLPKAPEVEKECAKLYFQNLHNIHPILEPADFLSRCDRVIWGPLLQGKSQLSHRNDLRSFLALYYSVLAIGAITAGEQSSLVWRHTVDFLTAAEDACGMRSNPSTYQPLRLARLFFEKSKVLMGDIFDSCSFEGAQTLFLMSVFCQNALKPHSCYMYSGMAARASLAIGVPNKIGPDSEPAAMLWWGLYSHEIEMCASAGRESALGTPCRYAVSWPRGPTTHPGRDMIGCMVSLAQLLNEVYTDVYLLHGEEHLATKSATCQRLDAQLLEWRASLPPPLNLDATSLTEPEQITKQKIVLRLRFFNARILLHRPFLIAASNPRDRNDYGLHVQLCVDASRKTIDLLYNAYLHRPYFRTWWYNCTYALYGSMILLYVVLTRLHTDPAEDLLRDAEKSLEIFKTMDMVAVARKCAEITQEVLDIARKTVNNRAMNERKLPPLTSNGPETASVASPGTSAGTVSGAYEYNGFDTGQDDVYATLLNNNLLSNVMEYDGTNMWLEGHTGALPMEQYVPAGPPGAHPATYGVLDYFA